jgi:hypothetical protein
VHAVLIRGEETVIVPKSYVSVIVVATLFVTVSVVWTAVSSSFRMAPAVVASVPCVEESVIAVFDTAVTVATP